jgi:hypothetical protein
MQDVVRDIADQWRPADTALHQVKDLLVTGIGAQPAQISCQASNRWRIGPAVVVHYDHQWQIVRGGDVVQSLPRHPAGERTIADECDNGARLALQANGLCQPVGVRESG